MSNCKLCTWFKGLFSKKCHCEEKGCDCQAEDLVENQETSSKDQVTVNNEEISAQESGIAETSKEN